MSYYGSRAKEKIVFVKELRDFTHGRVFFFWRNSCAEEIFVFSQLAEFIEKLFIDKI